MKKRIKTSFILLGLAVFFVIVHNAIYGIFKIEEPVFFILTFVFAFGFLVSGIYNILSIILNSKNSGRNQK